MIDLLIETIYIEFNVISTPGPYEGLSSMASGYEEVT